MRTGDEGKYSLTIATVNNSSGDCAAGYLQNESEAGGYYKLACPAHTRLLHGARMGLGWDSQMMRQKAIACRRVH